MARLSEPYVEATSIEYLKRHYCSSYNTEFIYSKSQAATINKGFADGFLCFHSDIQKYHSVSIEAKSHKTLLNLKPYLEINNFILHILIFSLLVGVIPTIYFTHLQWYWILLLYLLFSTVIFFLLGLILDKAQPNYYKKVDVVNQVNRYPANEKWVAISSDSVNLLKQRSAYIRGCSYENLVGICKREGIGMLVVNHLEPNVILHPKFKKGSFWTQYKHQDKVENYF